MEKKNRIKIIFHSPIQRSLCTEFSSLRNISHRNTASAANGLLCSFFSPPTTPTPNSLASVSFIIIIIIQTGEGKS